MCLILRQVSLRFDAFPFPHHIPRDTTQFRRERLPYSLSLCENTLCSDAVDLGHAIIHEREEAHRRC